MKNVVFFLLGIVLVTSCSNEPEQEDEAGLPFYNSSEYNPEWFAKGSEAYDEIHTVADFSFTNQLGEQIDQETIKNKIYVVNFFFTSCPGICPRMTNNLHPVQEAFLEDDDVLILSHTVTPWSDSVPQLKTYGEINKINPKKWHLLTGNKEELYKMGRLSYFVDEGYGKTVTDSNEFLHTENIILVDRKRRIRGVYSGTSKLEMKNLINDIHLLKSEI